MVGLSAFLYFAAFTNLFLTVELTAEEEDFACRGGNGNFFFLFS